MVCENCGAGLSPGASFCPSCGHSVTDMVDTTYQPNRNNYSGGQYNNQSHQYPPYNQPYSQPTQPTGNGMAIAGFVCAFFFPLLGLIFSCIGLSTANKRPGQPSRGLAIAGIVLSAISMTIALIVTITAASCAASLPSYYSW